MWRPQANGDKRRDVARAQTSRFGAWATRLTLEKALLGIDSPASQPSRHLAIAGLANNTDTCFRRLSGIGDRSMRPEYRVTTSRSHRTGHRSSAHISASQ